jgi:hypothetical protein
MKIFARLSVTGSCLGLFFLTAAPSFATVVGTLYTGGPGTVTVTPTSITFTENDTNNPTPFGPSSTEVGGGTTLTYDGPALNVKDPIDINAGNPIMPTGAPVGGVYPVDVPVTFPKEPTLSLTLTSFGPGTGTSCTSTMKPGDTCSPLGGASPIILTDEGPNLTIASLLVGGTATDSTGTSDVSGGFTQPIPEGIFALSTSTNITTTDAGTFTITARSEVPEPRAVSMIALAGLLMGFVVAKRRKNLA